MSFNRRGESGNVFFTLFGAVALVGVIGVATTTLMKGPVGTVVTLNQKAKIESQLQIARKLVALDAAQRLSPEPDCDGDGTIEPMNADIDATRCPTPITGGGCLPQVTGATRIDPWGTQVGYCAWDHATQGGSTDQYDGTNALCDDADATTRALLPGQVGVSNQPVLAVISAGANRTFETVCNNGGPNPTDYASRPAGSDDIVFEWTYEEAANGVGGGLWSLMSGTDAITTAKDVEFTTDATFNSGTSATFADSSSAAFNTGSVLDLTGGGLFRLPDQTNSGVCGAANESMLRIDTTAGQTLQICDPAAAPDWTDIGGSGASSSVAGSDGDIQFNSNGALWADSAFQWDVDNDRLLIGSPATANDTVEIEGTVGISSDLNVHGIIEVDAGSAGSPGFTFTSANNTGLFLDGTGDVGVSVGGTQIVDVTSSGVDVAGDLNTTDDVNVGNILYVSSNAFIDNNLDVGGVVYNSNGDLTVGDVLSVTSSAKFASNGHFVGAVNANRFLVDGTLNAGAIVDGNDGLESDGAGGLGLLTAGTRRLHIDSAGDIGIGVTGAPTATLDINGMLRLRNNSSIEAGDACTSQDGSIVYGSGDRLLICSSMTGFWETIGSTGGGGGGTVGLWERAFGAIQPIEGHGVDDFAFGNQQPETSGTFMFFDKSKGAFRVGTTTSNEWTDARRGTYSFGAGADIVSEGDYSFGLGHDVNIDGSHSGGFGLGNSAGVSPIITAQNSLGIFMGDQSGIDLSTNNVMLLAGGSLVIDPDTTSASNIAPTNGLTVDVEGSVGAMNFCNEDGTECFTAGDIASGSTGAPGSNREILYNSNGDMAASAGLIFSSSGGLGLNVLDTATRLDVNGTIKMAYDGEACDATREGGIQYNSSNDTFYVCRTAGQPWQALAAGAAAAAGGSREIQFNSGGYLATLNNFVMTTTGRLGVMETTPLAELHVGDATGVGGSAPTVVAARNGDQPFMLFIHEGNDSSAIGIGGDDYLTLASEDSQAGIRFRVNGAWGAEYINTAPIGMTLGSDGRLNVGAGTADTKFEVEGTMKMAYDGEACDATREGGIQYNSSTDTFYVCRTAGAGWQALAAGAASAGGADREIQFNSGGLLTGNANLTYAANGKVDLNYTDTSTAAVNNSGLTVDTIVNPGANQLASHIAQGIWSSLSIEGNFSKQTVHGLNAETINNGAGNVSSGWGLVGYFQNNNASSTVNAAGASYVGIENALGTLTWGTGIMAQTIVTGGTVGEISGLVVSNTQSGGSITDRYGILLQVPTGSPTRDWGFYQQGTQPNRLGGYLGVGTAASPTLPATQLDVAGTMKMAYDGEACDATREGGIHYNSSTDTFYVCRTAGAGWQALAAGAATAGGGDRQIQFNSGGLLDGNAGLVFSSTGDILVSGTYTGTASVPVSGAGTRFFYDVQTGAIRAGTTSGTHFDNAQIGANSAAFGENVRASGANSFATGLGSLASGISSAAIGNGATASGNYGYAIGNNVTSGQHGIAIGRTVNVTGQYSAGWGVGNAAGVAPIVSGNNTLGVFLGDQSGVTLSANNTMAILGGGVVIDPRAPALNLIADTALEIEGTAKLAYGGEACDATREGGIQYDSSSDTFYVCRTAGAGWQALAAGTSVAAGLNREIQFNSGGTFGTNANFVFGSSGNLGIGTNNPNMQLHISTSATQAGLRIEGNGTFNDVIWSVASLDTGDIWQWDLRGSSAADYGNYNLNHYDVATSSWRSRIGIRDDGRVGIGITDADTQLEIDGTLKIAYDGEACDATREGAIHYSSSADEFYACKTAGGGWQALQLGTTITAATPDRGIQFNSGGAFTASGNLVFSSTGDLMMVGSYTGTASVPTTGAGVRMFFDAQTGAFRAGSVTGTSWDNGSIGNYSFAAGADTSASGTQSTALNTATTAEGTSSLAAGYFSAARGTRSTALGNSASASGRYSFAVGNARAGNLSGDSGPGDGSFAFGLQDDAIGLSTPPSVLGIQSFGIFMDDQDGVVFSSNNTMGLFGGRFIIDPRVPATNLSADTAFEVEGTIKMSYGGEACDAAREGSLYYNSSSDTFFACQTSGSWTPLATGTPTAATPDRGIQFNSGGSFAASAGLVFTSQGHLHVGTVYGATNSARVHVSVAQDEGILLSETGGNKWYAYLNRADSDAGVLSLYQGDVESARIDGRVGGESFIGSRTRLGNSFLLSGDTSPAQITANTNNYDPANMANTAVLRVSTDASRDLTGLAGGADGRVLTILNVGAQPLVLRNESASSTAANRFLIGADLTLAANQSLTLVYDSTSTRWRPMSSVSAGGVGGSIRFTSLTDAPTSYTGQGLRVVRVNAGGTALEFTNNVIETVGGIPAPTGFMLDDIANVNVPSPTDGHCLKYTSATGLWETGACVSGSVGPWTINGNDIYYNSSGTPRVGIGNAAPTQALDVTGTVRASVGLQLGLTAGAAAPTYLTLDDISNVNAASPTAGHVLTYSGGNWIAAAPTGGSGGGFWTAGAGDDIYYNSGTAQVGIGNASPTEALDVTGNIKLSGGLQLGLMTGVAAPATLALDDLSNVTASSPSAGQVLLYSGGQWIPGTASGSASASGSTRQVQFNSGGAFAADTNFVYTSAGRLGIGNAAPTEMLHVTGNLRVTQTLKLDPVAGAAAPAGLTLDDLTNVTAPSPSAGQVLLYSGGAWIPGTASGGSGTPAGSTRQIQFNSGGAFAADTNLVYTTTGRVGIGNAAPTEALDVTGTVRASQSLQLGLVTGAAAPSVMNLDDLGNVNAASPSNGNVLLYSGGSWVAGTGGGGGGGGAFTDLSDVPSAYTGAGGQFVKVNPGATGLEFSTQVFTSVSGQPAPNGMYLSGLDDVDVSAANDGDVLMLSSGMWVPGVGGGGGGADLWSQGTGDDIYYNSGTTQVGIGNNSPVATLDVTGTVRISEGIQLLAVSGAASPTQLSLDDLQGVNVTSPTAGHVLTYSGGNWVSAAATGGGGTPAGSGREVQFRSGGAFAADTNFVFTSTGRLGIGIAAPTRLLHVYGSGDSKATFEANDGGAAAITVKNTQEDYGFGIGSDEKFHIGTDGTLPTGSFMTVDQSGRVGIGNTSPADLLHIADGNIRIDGTVGNQAGCMRYNDATDRLEYSNDCTTFAPIDNVAYSSTGGGSGDLVGTLTIAPATNCVWTSTSGTFASYTTPDNDCGAVSVTGSAVAPTEGKIPAIRFASLPAGSYEVTFNTQFYTTGSGTTCRYRISTGTANTGVTMITTGNDAGYLSGVFTFGSTQTNLTFYIEAIRLSGSNACAVYADEAGILPMYAYVKSLASSSVGSVSFPLIASPAGSAAAPAYSFTGSATTGMFSDTANTVEFAANGVQVLELGTVASGVNYLQMTPGTTGNAPVITTVGTDTSGNGLGITLRGKGATSLGGDGGEVAIQGGLGSSTGTNAHGGNVWIAGGLAANSGMGGQISINGGSGNAGGGGTVSVTGGGVAGGNGSGGGLQLYGGAGNSTGSGGAVDIQAGAPGTTGAGGAVTITARNGAGTNQNGGSVTLTAGDATGTGTQGLVKIASGAAFTGDISPASLGASQNDYAPVNYASASVMRLTASTPVNITGLAGGQDGRIMTLTNIGTNAITLTNEDAASTVANRFALSSNIMLAANQSAVLMYDSTSSRWRAMSVYGSAGAATAAGADRQIQFNSGGAFAANANLTYSSMGQLSARAAYTANTQGLYTVNDSYISVAPTADEPLGFHYSTGRLSTAMNAYAEVLAGSTFRKNYVLGGFIGTENYGTGQVVNLLGSSIFAGTQATTNNVTTLTGTEVFAYGGVGGGTITELNGMVVGTEISNTINATTIAGIRVKSDNSSSATPTTRYGIFLDTPVGTATNDWGFYQNGTQNNRLGGGLLLAGDISPAAIGASQNNYAPTNHATASVLRLTASGTYNITGLAGGLDGRIVTLTNIGANTITLTNEDAASTAANRFAIGSNITLAASQSAVLLYDSTSARWRAMATYGSGGSITPAGSDTQIQFNSGGTLAASSGLTFNSAGQFALGTTPNGNTLMTVATPNSTPVAWKRGAYISAQSTGSSASYNGTLGMEVIGQTSATGAGYTEAYGVYGTGHATDDAKDQYVYGVTGAAVTYNLDVGYALYAADSNNSTGGTIYGLYINLDDADVSRWGIYQTTANNNRLNGNLGIGVNPSVALDVTGDIEYTGTITDVSDRRLKTEILPLRDQGSMLEKIGMIDTYTFRMKDDMKRREYGVMAQELEKVFPELVHTADDEMGTKSVNYVGLIAPMIEATKELKAENDNLRAELASLRAERDEMKTALNDLATDVKGLKAHTGYGINRAEMGLWMLLIAFASGSLVLLLGGIVRNRQHKAE